MTPKYETKYCVENWASHEAALRMRGDILLGSPRYTAATSKSLGGALVQRDAAIERIKEVRRRQRRKESSTHQQGRAENAMFRYKRVIGDRLRARMFDAQEERRCSGFWRSIG